MDGTLKDETREDDEMHETGGCRRLTRGAWIAIACLGLGAASGVRAEDMAPMDHSQMDHSGMNHDMHAQHLANAPQDVKRAEDRVEIPKLGMQRHDGRKVEFPAELDDGRPVLVNFIFTTCTAICPILSRTFAQVQDKLAADGPMPHLVSISIDPENDTVSGPLPAYAEKFEAGPSWQFYTGSVENSIALQKAFKTFRGDKMNHIPVVFMRAKPGEPWLRLEGFASADRVVAEYRRRVGLH
ncbi:MAG: SCO family protein [Gammaproteobacteria bacterium]|nr:SCO family protein [Gammaproteobacteria bacterium]